MSRTVRIWAMLCAAVPAFALAFGGPAAAVGGLLGVVTGSFGAFALYASVKTLRDATRQTTAGVLLTLLAFFLKFPVIGLGVYVAIGLGMEALVACVSGVLMVYFALVWQATRSDLYPR